MKKFLNFLILCIVIIYILIVDVILYNFNINQKEVILLGSLIYVESEVKEEDGFNDMVKTSSQNVGVITCMETKNNRFVSFGHSISEEMDVSGQCYKANYLKIIKAKNNSVGSIEAVGDSTNKIGTVNKNTTRGLYGEITDFNNVNNLKSKSINVASRFQVNYGNVKLYLNLDGNKPIEYDAEVTGINYFDDNQNINIKITDDRLIELTGGVVRGMSGTPVLQDDKLIGVVNYVSNYNSTDAYAVFADKLF